MVLLSSIISQFIPDISVPLIQIALGVGCALIFGDFELSVTPEAFMLIFIAPLLFNDALRSDRAALWRLREPIAGIVVGLVFLSTIITGYVAHALLPVLSLAGCFALAASLGPTDAVSVASMARRTSIPRDEELVLQGESLFNDASGIIAFTFAVTALSTGAFNLLNAAGSFLLVFAGGLAVGVILALLRALFIRWVRATGIENTTFHVLIELITPFLIFIIAESLAVSGVIAVVCAALIQNDSATQVTPSAARLNLVSTSVWSVLVYTLNGTVFLIMGMRLPGVVKQLWLDANHHFDPKLILYIFVITAVIMLVRLIWTTGMVYVRHRKDGAFIGNKATAAREKLRYILRSATIMTVAGVRGTVTLSTIFMLPIYLADGSEFHNRALLVFLASGVILLTMIIANFVLPLLAPHQTDHLDEDEATQFIDILRQVLLKLNDQVTPENARATEEVVRAYNARIDYIKTHHAIDDAGRDRLRLMILDWEKENTLALMESKEVSTGLGFSYLFSLNRIRDRVHTGNRRRFWMLRVMGELRARRRAMGKVSRVGLSREQMEKTQLHMNALHVSNYDYVLDKLNGLLDIEHSEHDHAGHIDVEDISAMIVEYRRHRDRYATAGGDRRSVTGAAMLSPLDRKHHAQVTEIRHLGLQYEREAIMRLFDDGKLSRKRARELRDNVALMELDLAAELD
ncbi:MAG: sodium:proton antiporter [Actinomycetes bacterium]|jgi:CPA1 family monovalent cation:H+ antiporter|nr:sodium:proton antiporter [Actinomycetes bacterium]